MSYLKNVNKRFDIQPPKAIGRASHLPRRAHPVCQLAHTAASQSLEISRDHALGDGDVVCESDGDGDYDGDNVLRKFISDVIYCPSLISEVPSNHNLKLLRNNDAF